MIQCIDICAGISIRKNISDNISLSLVHNRWQTMYLTLMSQDNVKPCLVAAIVATDDYAYNKETISRHTNMKVANNMNSMHHTFHIAWDYGWLYENLWRVCAFVWGKSNVLRVRWRSNGEVNERESKSTANICVFCVLLSAWSLVTGHWSTQKHSTNNLHSLRKNNHNISGIL